MELEITNNVARFNEILVHLWEKISQDPENPTTVRIYSRVINCWCTFLSGCYTSWQPEISKENSLQYPNNSDIHSSSWKLIFWPPFRLWNRFMEHTANPTPAGWSTEGNCRKGRGLAGLVWIGFLHKQHTAH